MYKSPQTDFKKLRKQAEKRLPGRTADIETMPSEDINKLIHELEVHQIELEIQNEELRNSQLELEAERNKYSNLYDHYMTYPFYLLPAMKKINY